MKIPAKKRLKVAVIFGGRSGEHEVSIVSARSILKALDRKRWRPLPVAVLKDGRWLGGENAGRYLDGKKPDLRAAVDVFSFRGVDVAFPIIHGTYGEDGSLQGLLEMAGVPYVGCGVAASAIGMDKDVQKRVLAQGGIATAKALVVSSAAWRKNPGGWKRRAAREIGWPSFVKPARLGSSVGISKVKAGEALAAAVESALKYDEKILIERAVPNAREIEIAVMGNDPYRTTAPGEIVPSGEFYDFFAKYVDNASECLIPAPIGKKLASELRAAAERACRLIGVEGMARVDFLLERGSGRWALNELNTLPGFTAVSMYPKLWLHEGLSYPRMISDLLDLALRRGARRARLTTEFNSKSDWYK